MSKALQQLVVSRFGAQVLSTHAQHGDETVVLEREAWKSVHAFLRNDTSAKCDMLSDLTVVDFPERNPRFEVVSHLYSLSLGHRLRLKTAVGDPEGEDARVDSLTSLWASANWLEREAFDMFGVRFTGHPDLRRILMYPEFVGHPLRKDYPADRIQPLVPFRDVQGTEKLAPFGPYEGMSFGRRSAYGSQSEE
jgi:NADH-quinone oxidoreductase subunit C